MRYALVDGYNLIFRAFHGMPELTRADGLPTGAIHGWVRTLWWIADNMGADRIVVCFDLGGSSRQSALLESYKANRAETPEALRPQIPFIKAWTRAMGYHGLESEGIEADELIAAASRQLSAGGHEVRIVSADKDLAQLVGGSVTQWVPPPTANPKLGWRELDAAGVEAKFGVPPHKIADYLALMGDSSDNIPGIDGVGPKTAAEWIRRYGSVEGVIDHCGELSPKRFQTVVHARQADLRRNLELTRLSLDHPLGDLTAPAAVDPSAVIAILEELGMTGTVAQARKRLNLA